MHLDYGTYFLCRSGWLHKALLYEKIVAKVRIRPKAGLYQKLFNYMADEHDAILLDSEIQEIIDIVKDPNNE